MTEQEQIKAEQIAAAADKFIAAKEGIRGKLNEYGATTSSTDPFCVYPSRVDAIGQVAKLAASSISGMCIVDVELNCDGTYETPVDVTEQAELLNGAMVAVVAQGFLTKPYKVSVTDLVSWRKRIIVPVPDSQSVAATVLLDLGKSSTCSYRAPAVAITLAAGATRSVSLRTVQTTGGDTVVEVCRIQPYTSTANDSGDSWLAQRVTTAAGTTLHLGYYDGNNVFHPDAGVKVPVWTVPADATSVSDCTENQAYGEAGDADIFSLLKVLGEEKVVNINYVGDSSTVENKFVRFSPVYVKTTFETLTIPIMNEGVQTGSVEKQCVIRWFCDTRADADYHLHSAFVRYERSGENTFVEREVPYAYVSRYPINNVSLTCGGVSYAMAKSQSDGSNEVGNTRAGFLDRCRNVNKATVTVTDPDTSETLLTVAADSDSRAMSMIDLPMMSLIEDLAFLLFGNDAQSQLRGVSSSSAYSQQANGVTDFIANLGIKLGGQNPHSAEFNFNFLDIEGGTWSAPGCMFPNYTSIVERITSTDAEGNVTSVTRNRYIVAIDRLDYNPGSSDVDNLIANGYRWVAFNVSGKRRVGLDDTQVMRDAKLFCADQTAHNINYAGVDEHWQGGAPGAIASYSATATYSVGAYVIYEGKLYRCTTAVEAAEAFDAEKWELQVNAQIIARSYYMVARGGSRSYGASLGPLSLNAYNGLSTSNGSNWRSRLSYLPLPAANDE